MYTINFYINSNWIDLSNYLVSSDEIPFISRNIDCSLRVEEFNMSISDKIKDTLGSNFEFADGTPVHIKRENITIFSGVILKSEYNYNDNVFDLRIISDLSNLRGKYFSYNSFHNLLIDTSDLYMCQQINWGTNNNYIVNPIWVLKKIFEFFDLTLDASELLESTFTYFKWDDVNLSEVKYKQLFMAELLLYYLGMSYYSIKPNPLVQPRHINKIERGAVNYVDEYYDFLLSPNSTDDWEYVHYLDEGDSIKLDWLFWKTFDTNEQITIYNRYYTFSEVITTEELRKATRIRIYAPKGLKTVDQSTLDIYNNAPENLPNVYVHKFLNNGVTCEEIVSDILSYLGLQIFITGYKQYKISVGNYFDINPNSPFFGYYIGNNYTISDSEKYNYKVIKNKSEYNEDNYKFTIPHENSHNILSGIYGTYMPEEDIYKKRDIKTLNFGAGSKNIKMTNNLEIYFRSSTSIDTMYFCRLPIKSLNNKIDDIILKYYFYLYTITQVPPINCYIIASKSVNDYSMVPSMFLHKLIKECYYEQVEVVCDAKTELKSVLENFIDIKNDISKITYLKSTEITI